MFQKFLTLQAIIVGADGRMAPFGSAGELWIRGYSVKPGYWDEKQKTEELIRPDGWLKTG
jgi:long-subunit acyl-CoA synthetase (AMP-forming)